MRRVLHIVWLLLVSVSAPAQQRTVRVRMFWQHPPAKIRIAPERATVRTCAICPAKSLSRAVEVVGQGSELVVGTISSSTVLLNGKARITGNGFPPFTIDNELRVESRVGLLLLTLTMTLEQYVTAVVQGESSNLKSDEALKAMAVAARTYAVHFGSRHRLEAFDFCDTTHCQNVRLDNESPRVRAAAAATEGELLWFEGRPAATYYHRSCGGEIEDASAIEAGQRARYLRQHHDEYCIRTPDEWHSEISKSDLASALTRQVNTVVVAARSESGRVQRLLVNHRPISATNFRFAIGHRLGWDKLRSDLYQIEDIGDRISFRGRGQGHGVGLCQTGADNMGEQGHSYREILAFYYPGTALGLNAQGLSWEKLPSESLDIVTTRGDDSVALLPAAERALRFATQRTGWSFRVRPQVKVYPTIDVYRDATGAPGWVAASTAGNVIRLQPIIALQRTHALDSTLRHEFLHLLIESKTRFDAPLWLREGLVVYLCSPDSAKPAKVDVTALERRWHSLRSEEETRAAYRDSANAVANAVEENGLTTVISWLNTMK